MHTDLDQLDSAKAPHILILGFCTVMVLLTMAGLAAFRLTHLIQQGVAVVATEQFLISRLVHDVQVEENVMTEVLHQLAYFPQKTRENPTRIADLEESALELSRLAEEARKAVGSALWGDLQAALRVFIAEVRSVLAIQGPVPRENQERLFSEHARVVDLINSLIRDCSEQLDHAEHEIDEQSRSLELRAGLLLGSGLLLAAASAGATVWFARRSIRRIQWHSEELSRVSWHMIQTQEDAARRFSHELHDELGQSLAALRSNLSKASTEDLASLRADCISLVDESIANVRELSQLLRPVLLDDFGLDASLRWLAEKFGQRTQIEVEYTSSCSARFLDETETHLFRIAQEALTNVAKHSKASRVHLSLTQNKNLLRLRIADNGIGIADLKTMLSEHPTLGMVGMRARARNCGGTLQVTHVTPHGLCVEAEVPSAQRIPTA